MPDYRVRFCNDLSNSTGRMFHVAQRIVEVRGAPNPDVAVEEAKQTFKRSEGVADWRHRATMIECEEIA